VDFYLGESKPNGGTVLSKKDAEKFTVTEASYQIFNRLGEEISSGTATVIVNGLGVDIKAQLNPTDLGNNLPVIYTCQVVPEDPEELPQTRKYRNFINVKKPA
jgi:hypothetical protein